MKPWHSTAVSLILFSSMSVLTACSGGGSDSGNEGDVVSTPPPTSSSSSSGGSSSGGSSGGPILYENFGDGLYVNFDEGDTGHFFSQEYKALDANNPQDPWPSFYYPTCCFFANDNPADGPEAALDQMGIVSDNGNPSLLLNTGRFTAGQTRPDIEDPDPKKDTTSSGDVTTWGELDLNRDYRISFCVKDAAGSRNMQVYVDNNTTSEGNSFWGGGAQGSRIFNVPVDQLKAGKRVEINVPGNITFEPGGETKDFRPVLVGGPSSFLQFRVEGGSSVVFDDLLVEYQDENGQADLPTCNVFTPPTAPDAPTAPSASAGDARIIVDWSEILGASTYDLAHNTSDSTESATLVEGITDTQYTLEGLANGTQYFVFVRAKNSAGTSDWSPSASATPEEPSGCSPTTQLDTAINWGVWDGCLAPNVAGAVVINGSTPTSFTVVEGNEVYFTANDNGTTTLDSTGEAVKPTADLAGVMSDSGAGYPRHFTWIGRINAPVNSDSVRGIEVEISFGEADGRRVKTILRPDAGSPNPDDPESKGRIQLEKFTDGSTTAQADVAMNGGYQIYQVALTLNGEADVTARIYRDGENISHLFAGDETSVEISGTGSTSGSSSPRLRIGDGGSSGYKSDVDWLIWTDEAGTAAMEPAELVGELPEGIGELGPYAPAQ